MINTKTSNKQAIWIAILTIVSTACFANASVNRVSTAYFDQFKSVKTSSKVDPADPPKYLRIRVADRDEKPMTLFLVRHSVRCDDYQVWLFQSPEQKTKVETGLVRTYRGWVEELPDTMVSAVLMPDGKVSAWLLRDLKSQGYASSTGEGPGAFTVNKPQGRNINDSMALGTKKLGTRDVTFLSGSPNFVSGTPYKNAFFAPGRPASEPFLAQCTRLDHSFFTDPGYFEVKPDTREGHEETISEFEFGTLGYDLISLRCGLESARVAKIMLARPGVTINTKAALSKMKPSDVFARMRAGGGGGASGLGKLNSNSGYMTSTSAMWHELGHKCSWGGDYQGSGVEPGLLGGHDNSKIRNKIFGTPAVNNRMRKRMASRKDKQYNSMVEYIETPRFPIPPYARLDRVATKPRQSVVIDFMVNDFDVNGGFIALADFETKSEHGGTITCLPGSGPQGRDAFRYTPLDSFTGEDRFSYSIVDSDGRIGYGNVSIGVVLSKCLLAHMPLDNFENMVERDYQYGSLDSNLSQGKNGHISINWHKHRTKPFVAFWNVQRSSGRGGYWDSIKDPIYDLTTARNESWSKEAFTFDVSGQPFLNSSTGTYDLTMHRWGYSKTSKKWILKEGQHADVIAHEVALLVDGRVVARTAENKQIRILEENVSDGKMYNGSCSYRLEIKDIDEPSVKKALQVAAASRDYIQKLIIGKPLESVTKVSGPKVEIRITLSRDASHFSGGLMMTPVDSKLEKLTGKLGQCAKVHGFEEVSYSISADGNVNRSLCVWVWAPTWQQVGDPYVIKYLGRNGVYPDRKSSSFVFSNVHAFGKDDYQTFPAPPTGKWFHLAITYGREAKLYVNGKLAANTPRATVKELDMGRIGFNFTGAFDDLRIYSGALAPADIEVVMKGGNAEFTSPVDASVTLADKPVSY
jgi:hypothetical protein